MTVQPFQYQQQQTWVPFIGVIPPGAFQTITFTFPPVPQGTTMTGTIMLALDPPNEDPRGTQYTVYRNGFPVATVEELGSVLGIQAVGQETISVVGVYYWRNDPDPDSQPDYTVTCTWVGYSQDSGSAPVVLPQPVSNGRGLVEVYNPPSAPLYVQEIPWPYYQFITADITGGGPVVVLPAPVGNLRIQQVILQGSAAQLSTVSGAKSVTVSLQYSSGTFLTQLTLSTIPGSIAQDRVEQWFDQEIDDSLKTDSLWLSSTGYGGTSYRVNLMMTYGYP